jgi:hypothetical protein
VGLRFLFIWRLLRLVLTSRQLVGAVGTKG